MILCGVTSRNLNPAAISTSCAPYNSAQECCCEGTHIYRNPRQFPWLSRSLLNMLESFKLTYHMTIYQILTMANLLRAIVMWQSHDLEVCVLCHRDIFPNFVMLAMATTTFTLIAQFEGKLSISYLLLDSCDSLHTYFEYDVTIARHSSSDYVYTIWRYTHNHANVEFAPASTKTTGSNYVNSSWTCPTCACRRKPCWAKSPHKVYSLAAFADFILFSHACWLESCLPISWIVAGRVTTTSTALWLLS